MQEKQRISMRTEFVVLPTFVARGLFLRIFVFSRSIKESEG